MFDQRAASLRTRFGAECFRLWDLERDVNPLPTVSAALFLNIAWAADGDDRLARDFIGQGKQIAYRLGLFGGLAEMPTQLDHDGIMELRANAGTAWGLFNFMTCACTFHHPPTVS